MTRIERHSSAWYEALDAYVAERAARPFVWGSQDCGTFAADWVLLATGQDPMADLRGLDTAVAAHRKLAELGGTLAAVDTLMGQHLGGPFAQAGDLAMVTLDETGRTAMTVCLGGWLAIPGIERMEMLPMDRAQASWRV